MLRITEIREMAADGSAAWVLKLQGNIQGEWVKELQRAWRGIRGAAAGARICVVLADVPFVDAAGQILLTEMHRDGVEILPTDSLTTAVREDVVTAVAGRTQDTKEGG